jgi:hypothetical protein
MENPELLSLLHRRHADLVPLSYHLATADLARINRESPNFPPLLNFIPPAWWARRDLLQDKVLRTAGLVFKDISPAGLRWLRRAPAETLICFYHSFEETKQQEKKSEADSGLLSIVGEVAEVMAGLPPQAAGQPELAALVIKSVWRLLLNINKINSKPDPVLIHRLVRLLARHLTATWAGAGGKAAVISFSIGDEIIDWFRVEGQRQGLPDKNSTWLSIKRRSDKWHEEVWRRRQRERQGRRGWPGGCFLWRDDFEAMEKEENAAWVSLLGEMTIDSLKIKPLVSDLDLYKEGLEMRHCVSSYTWQCLKGGWRLFSLLETDGTRSTLSLRPQSNGFVIDQHKGLANNQVSPAASKVAREVCRL